MIESLLNKLEDTIENKKIEKAREFLESNHSTRSPWGFEEKFTFLKKEMKGKYERYYFYRGDDTTYIYVVLSDAERKEIIKSFKNNMGDTYVYYDSIISKFTGDVIQHRFYCPGGKRSVIFMAEDDGTIWGCKFAMDLDLYN